MNVGYAIIDLLIGAAIAGSGGTSKLAGPGVINIGGVLKWEHV